MNIRLHIEHLVLEGLPISAAEGPAVQAALEAELARLLAEQGLGRGLRQGAVLAYAQGGELALTPSCSPEVLGREIGRAAYGGISQ